MRTIDIIAASGRGIWACPAVAAVFVVNAADAGVQRGGVVADARDWGAANTRFSGRHGM